MYMKRKQRKGKARGIAHIIGRTCRCMGLKRNIGFLAFFGRLLPQDFGTFLTEALVTLGAATSSGGSAAVIGDIKGAVESSLGGSSSSL
jgi:hypothetical protein